jgi:hypothetical protein
MAGPGAVGKVALGRGESAGAAVGIIDWEANGAAGVMELADCASAGAGTGASVESARLAKIKRRQPSWGLSDEEAGLPEPMPNVCALPRSGSAAE